MRFLDCMNRKERLNAVFLTTSSKKIVHFMVAETALVLMFCFKNKAKDRVVKEPGEAVLIKRKSGERHE
jgi:hypothetical protein